MAEDASFWQTLREYFNKPKTRDPQSILPSVKTDLKALTGNDPFFGLVRAFFLFHQAGRKKHTRRSCIQQNSVTRILYGKKLPRF
jgi:hypothetical protein